MTSDTKAIIGTILATGIGMGMLATSRIAGNRSEIAGNRSEIRAVRSEIRGIEDGLATEIRAFRSEAGSRIDALRDDMRENYRLLDGRIRTIEIAFAKVDQRLETLEQAVIPSAEPAE